MSSDSFHPLQIIILQPTRTYLQIKKQLINISGPKITSHIPQQLEIDNDIKKRSTRNV